MPNTTIQNFGIPDRVDSLWNDLDEYTSFEPLIRVKSFYTPLYSQWNEEKHCIKYTSKTNTTELASTQNQFSHFTSYATRAEAVAELLVTHSTIVQLTISKWEEVVQFSCSNESNDEYGSPP